MKIICIIQRFFPVIGGAEKILERLMDKLAANHDVMVYTSNAHELDSFWNNTLKPVDDIQTKKYTIKRYAILQPRAIPEDLNNPIMTSYPGPFCPDLWHDLLNLQEPIDLIIASSFPYDHIIPAFIASKKYNIPLILIPFLHLQYPEYYFTGTKMALLNDSDAIMVMTSIEKHTLINQNIDEKKIHIIPGTIDTSNHTSRKNIREKLSINSNSIMILFVGTMSYAKGAMSLVDSLELLLKKQIDIDLVFIGPTTKDFEFYIKKYDYNTLSHIHNLGLVSDDMKWDLFFSCDVFALPSQSESLGLVYLEAWKFKKPVIGCDISSVREVIDNNENGFLVKFGDIQQLASAIELLQDKSKRTKFGENGHEKLLKIYDSDLLYAKFENLCIDMTSRNSK